MKKDSKKNKFWMRHALMLAKKAESYDEVPIGAVLILNNNIIGEGWNRSISHNDPTAHAEILALRQGGKAIGNYRLLNSIMYVTLEPCIMCIGAMIHARISHLIFGAKKIGGVKLFFNMFKYPFINHKFILTSGILSKECSSQLSHFFLRLRSKK